MKYGCNLLEFPFLKIFGISQTFFKNEFSRQNEKNAFKALVSVFDAFPYFNYLNKNKSAQNRT